jgi:hypothetical protein
VLHNIQTAERLTNGDTVIFSSTGGSKRENRPNIIQALEVTPDKKLVWVLQYWKNLGPATTAQFLDQPGIPEKPGDLQRYAGIEGRNIRSISLTCTNDIVYCLAHGKETRNA